MSDVEAALNRLCKWRTVFAGWQLGTRADTDPETQAIRDHRDLSMILRVEVSALVRYLSEKDLLDGPLFSAILVEEANALSEMYERKFPGFKATDEGLSIDPSVAAETMRGWKP